MKTRTGLLVFALALAVPGVGAALMPPHVTETTPADGGELAGDTVIIRGYSLDYADVGTGLRVVDPKGKAVALEHETTCRPEGRCTDDAPPGACQSKCEIRVKLKGVAPGARLTLVFLDARITFSVVAAR